MGDQAIVCFGKALVVIPCGLCNILLPVRKPITIIIIVPSDRNVHPGQVPVNKDPVEGIRRIVPITVMSIRFAHLPLVIQLPVFIPVAESLQVVGLALGQADRIDARSIGQYEVADQLSFVIEYPNDYRTWDRTLVMDRTRDRRVLIRDNRIGERINFLGGNHPVPNMEIIQPALEMRRVVLGAISDRKEIVRIGNQFARPRGLLGTHDFLPIQIKLHSVSSKGTVPAHRQVAPFKEGGCRIGGQRGWSSGGLAD